MPLSDQDKSELFASIQTFCTQLKSNQSESKTTMQGIEDIYLMHKTAVDKKLESLSEAVALTKSTDERVAVKGVTRLLSTVYPKVNVVDDNRFPKGGTDKINEVANALMSSSNRVNRKPLHNDACLAGVLHDLIVIRVTCTKDMLDKLEQEKKLMGELSPVQKSYSNANRKRLKELVQTSPFIFEVLNPINCYPLWDRFGLRKMLIVTKVTLTELIATYGDVVRDQVAADANKLDEYELWDYTDDLYRCVWLFGHQPIILDEHGLPGLNFVATTAEGSAIFEKASDQVEPFLLTVYRSGLDQRKTEALTSTFTNARILGYSPLIRFTEGDSSDVDPVIQKSGLFQYVRIPKGGLWQIGGDKGVVDPSTWNGLSMAQGLTEQATIFKSALGQSQSNTYSQTALLSQLGRIPLESIRIMVGQAISDALEIAFDRIKADGKAVKVYNFKSGALAELNPEDLPEYFNLECKLDIALPTDKLQQSTVATNLSQVGIVSEEWIQDKILNIESPIEMRKQIIKEQTFKLLVQIEQQKKLLTAQIELQQMQMQLQQMQQPPEAAQQEAAPPGQQPSPEELAQMHQMMALQQTGGGPPGPRNGGPQEAMPPEEMA